MMIQPMETGLPLGSSRRVAEAIRFTLRGAVRMGRTHWRQEPKEFQKQLYALAARKQLNLQRGNIRPLEELEEPEREMVAIRLRAVLRAGDWVIAALPTQEGFCYQLGYGLEGETVLLDGGDRVSLEEWLRTAQQFWLLTVTFSPPDAPIDPEQVSTGVYWLQRRLNRVLGTKLTEDGRYGGETAAAAERFLRIWRSKERCYREQVEIELAQRLDFAPSA